MGLTVIGCDIGQRVDPTAVVVVEAVYQRRADGIREYLHTVRDLGRLPLGTSYPDVAAKLAEVVGKLEARKPTRDDVDSLKVAGKWTGWAPPSLVVDATGVGRPVVDVLAAALRGHSCELVPVTFTYGDRFTRDGGEWRLGKAFLVSQLQAVLQTGRLELPKRKPEVEAMVRELQDYEHRVDEDANDRYGAFKVGTHDDLVTALGLAVCYAEQDSGQATRTRAR